VSLLLLLMLQFKVAANPATATTVVPAAETETLFSKQIA